MSEQEKRFKDYVHARLDAAGVSTDPESPHKAEGCRIGGRLDELIVERDRLRALNAELLASLKACEVSMDTAAALGVGDILPPAYRDSWAVAHAAASALIARAK